MWVITAAVCVVVADSTCSKKETVSGSHLRGKVIVAPGFLESALLIVSKRPMFAQLFFFVFVLLVFAVLAFKSFVTIKEGEYAVIYRLGKLDRWSGPGAIIIVPFIDRVVRVPLHLIVGWQTMRQEELEKNVVKIAMKMALKMPI